jgi:hypothetical protein
MTFLCLLNDLPISSDVCSLENFTELEGDCKEKFSLPPKIPLEAVLKVSRPAGIGDG